MTSTIFDVNLHIPQIDPFIYYRLDLPHPGIKLEFPVFPALQAGSLPTEPSGKPYIKG